MVEQVRTKPIGDWRGRKSPKAGMTLTAARKVAKGLPVKAYLPKRQGPGVCLCGQASCRRFDGGVHSSCTGLR